MKKIFALLVVFCILSSSVVYASVNKPLENIGKGLNEVVYGEIEVPDNIDETGTKGSPAYSDCTSKTNSGVGRGIVKVVGGLWKIATFWYPEDEK